MAFLLSERAQAAGHRLAAFETIGSTNAEALRLAHGGDAGNLWLATDHQTAGRGRRGASWEGPKGNLAATFLQILPAPHARVATLGFVAGLSLHDALLQVAPDIAPAIALDGGAGIAGNLAARFSLKWPNDVMADGAKLSGILLESEGVEEGGLAVAVGLGVNVGSAPQGLGYPATSLRDLGAAGDVEALFAALSEHWCTYLAMWDEGRGLAAIRDAWLDRAAGLGRPVALKLGGEVTRGIFETIDEECRLVMRTEAGACVHVSAGEVHFGTAATHRGA